MDPDPMVVKFMRDWCRVDELLRLHAPDLSGHCPCCTAGASGSGHVMSPCVILSAALKAGQVGVALRVVKRGG